MRKKNGIAGNPFANFVQVSAGGICTVSYLHVVNNKTWLHTDNKYFIHCVGGSDLKLF